MELIRSKIRLDIKVSEMSQKEGEVEVIVW